jgi:FkbM family methyltransferase
VGPYVRRSVKPLRLAIAQRTCRILPPLLAQRLRSVVYPAAVARRDDYEFVACSQTGAFLQSRTSDVHGYPFSVHGYYEWRNWAIALACCAPGDTIVEIGANIGTETVGFADIVGPGGVVHAFEPLPSNLAALRRNVNLNGDRHDVRVHPIALSDRNGRERFTVPAPHSSGTGHIVASATRDGAEEAAVEVECAMLDALTDDIGASRLIVMDVEGEEVKVLRGGGAYIRRFAPVLVLEASPQLLARGGFGLRDLHHEVVGLGHDPYRVSRLGLTQKDLLTYPHASNWACLPTATAGRAVALISRSIKRCGLCPCVSGINPMTRRRRADGVRD